MSANTARITRSLEVLERLKTEMPETNDWVVEKVLATGTRDIKDYTANGHQHSEVLTENRISELRVDTLIESAFRISHYPYSRFWAVYDGDDLVAVTVYRRGAEEVRRRLQAAADLQR